MESNKNRLTEKQPLEIMGSATLDELGRNSFGSPIVLKFAGTDEDKVIEKMNYDNIIGTFASMIEKYAGAFEFAGKAVQNGA